MPGNASKIVALGERAVRWLNPVPAMRAVGRGAGQVLGTTGVLGGPLTAGAIGVAGALAVESLFASPMAEAVRRVGRREEMGQARAELAMRERMQQLAMRRRLDRIREAMGRNAVALAVADPQLYQEVLAGRRLPRDATVIGGQPRMDLLDELTLGMAQGRFLQQGPQP